MVYFQLVGGLIPIWDEPNNGSVICKLQELDWRCSSSCTGRRPEEKEPSLGGIWCSWSMSQRHDFPASCAVSSQRKSQGSTYRWSRPQSAGRACLVAEPGWSWCGMSPVSRSDGKTWRGEKSVAAADVGKLSGLLHCLTDSIGQLQVIHGIRGCRLIVCNLPEPTPDRQHK